MTDLTPEEQCRLTKETFVKRVDYHPVLVSTNDRSLELAREPYLETPLLVVAGEQTAGRGRGANRWWSSEGALTFSLILEPGLLDLAQALWPRVAVVTGLSLCEIFRDLAPEARVGLKWPNDVWLNEKKAAGILVEVPPLKYPVPQRLIVGIGANVNNRWEAAPLELRDRGTSLSDVTGRVFSCGDLLVGLIGKLSENLRLLADSPERLPPRWRQFCALSGRTVAVQQGERLVRGICRGIDDDGGILLESSSERVKLYGGIVVEID